jgi:hypothetical protein
VDVTADRTAELQEAIDSAGFEPWTVDGDAAPIPELSFGEAERWWKSTQR